MVAWRARPGPSGCVWSERVATVSDFLTVGFSRPHARYFPAAGEDSSLQRASERKTPEDRTP